MKISALILAAGSGKRIGKPKLMLEIGGKSFLSVIIERIKIAGIDDVICVVSEKTYEWAKDNVSEIKFAINPNPVDGMISSVFYGMQKIKKCNGVFIIPVDHPFVEVKTYKILFDEFCKNGKMIIKPKYKDKSGHPVIIPYELLNSITKNNFSSGLDEVIKKSGYKQMYVEINDKSILKNINNREDFLTE
jgi:molybdenum cofactor cytidylyltransferase